MINMIFIIRKFFNKMKTNFENILFRKCADYFCFCQVKYVDLTYTRMLFTLTLAGHKDVLCEKGFLTRSKCWISFRKEMSLEQALSQFGYWNKL